MNYFMIPGLKVRACKNSDKIIGVCKSYFVLDFFKNTREKEYVFARQACMYLIYKNCGYSLKKTGQLFNKDHTVVIHSIRSIENYMFTKSVYECQQLYHIMVELGMIIPDAIKEALNISPMGIATELHNNKTIVE